MMRTRETTTRGFEGGKEGGGRSSKREMVGKGLSLRMHLMIMIGHVLDIFSQYNYVLPFT